MKKFDLKSGLSFGIFMAVFNMILILWEMEIYITATVLRGVVICLIGGVFAGFLFGLFSGWYKTSKYAEKKTSKEI